MIRTQKILENKLQNAVSLFTNLSRPEQRQFLNALYSDGGATNPKLANRGKGHLSSGDETDYFRAPRNQRGIYQREPEESITPARVTLSVRMRTNPIRGLTFERFVTYLDQWRLGFFRMAGMAWDTMERRDYQLQIVRPKRMKSAARHGYDVIIRDDVTEAQMELAQRQKEFLNQFYGNLTATNAINPDEEGGFALLVRQMMDAVGKYYAVHEIIWVPMPGRAQSPPPAANDEAGMKEGSGRRGTPPSGMGLTAKFIFCPIWWFEGTRGKLRFLPSEFQIYGNEMLPGEWLVTCGEGVMESCSVLYLMKTMLLKSNLAFLDKFGQPGIHGETDAPKGSVEWNNFVEAVHEFGEEWATVTNRGAKINLIETAAHGDAGYQALLEVFDRAITQLWRGSDLGTKSSQHAAGASLQEDESEILETDDCKMIEETLDVKVTRFALAWKFGEDAPQLAYVKLRTTPRRDVQTDIAVDTFLAGFTDKNGKGLLGVANTLERYARPMPGPEENILLTKQNGGNPSLRPNPAPAHAHLQRGAGGQSDTEINGSAGGSPALFNNGHSGELYPYNRSEK
ncbi:MAG TPA: DUF935 family protein [Verrucomicrobiae bacterium]